MAKLLNVQQNRQQIGGTKRKREEEKADEEKSRKKLREAKRELLQQSYLKLKLIADTNSELLKLLQVCKVMDKNKKDVNSRKKTV